jgi:hypothetical protein
MFGQPETAVAPSLDMLRQIQRVVQRIGRRGPFRDERKIENGERPAIWRQTKAKD